MRDTRLITMIEGAIIAAICVALSFIPLNTANAAFDLSLGLVPLGVYALRRGALPGLAVGFVWGLLLIVLGKAYILMIPQVILEYPIAFAFGGLGGVFSGQLRKRLSLTDLNDTGQVGAGQNGAGQNDAGQDGAGQVGAGQVGAGQKTEATRNLRGAVLTVVFAGILAAAARWFFHFWAGVIFWGSYAPEGMDPYLYSFIFNGASAATNAAMLAVVLAILVKTARSLFITKR